MKLVFRPFPGFHEVYFEETATFFLKMYSISMPLEKLQEDLETDKVLFVAAKSDPRQFGKIFDRYYPTIFGYALRRTADIDAAADIASTTFTKAFIAFRKFEWRNVRLSSWLYRIATNELTAHFRHRKLHLEIRIVDAPAEAIIAASLDADRTAIDAELQRHQQYRWLQGAISHLPSRYQSVLSLRYLERKSLIEIAEILCRPEGTIKSLLSRGTMRLKNEWREHESTLDREYDGGRYVRRRSEQH